MIERATKAAVERLLRGELQGVGVCARSEKATGWTIQGLGMLRLYLDDARRYRLHVWDSRFQAKDVSVIHDHPWTFASMVVAGQVVNHRYQEVEAYDASVPLSYTKHTIVCGEGGGVCSTPEDVWMKCDVAETVVAGEAYEQRAEEIHQSLPSDGTVTIIERVFGEDTETAHVYSLGHGSPFVSAEPRAATCGEVYEILKRSLERWF